MKKRFYFLFLLLMIIIPGRVFAYDLTCDKGSYDFGNSFTCKIDGITGGSEYDEISGTFSIPEELSCKVSSVANGLTNAASDNVSFNLSGTPQDTTAVTLSCNVAKKMSDKGNVQITVDSFTTHIKGSKDDASVEKLRSNSITLNKYIEVTTEKITKSRNTSNASSLLSSLKADNLDFTFSKYITEYDEQVLYSVKDITFTYKVNQDGATVKATSDTNELEVKDDTVYTELAIGDNTIDFEVTSADGLFTTVYTINVERLDKGKGLYDKNTDSSLKSLTVGDYNIDFNPETLSYSINVAYDVESIPVNAVANVDGASIEIYNNNNIQGNTTITIVVTALDKTTTTTYSIKVNKGFNYTKLVNYLTLGVGALAIIFLIYKLIQAMNKKKKDDPIYKLKQKKKVNNKGAKLDENSVPTVQSPVQPVVNQTVQSVVTPQFNTTPVQPVVTPQVNVTPVQPTATPQANVAPVQPVVAPQANVAPIQPTVTPQANVAPVQPTVTPQVNTSQAPVVVQEQVVNNNTNNGSN